MIKNQFKIASLKGLLAFLSVVAALPASADWKELKDHQKTTLTGAMATYGCWASRRLIPKTIAAQLSLDYGQSFGMSLDDMKSIKTNHKSFNDFASHLNRLTQPYGGYEQMCDHLVDMYEILQKKL